MKCLVPLALFSLLLAACASLDFGAAKQDAALRATQAGFIKETDEPTSRGQIQKVTPDEMDVEGAFSLSPDGEVVV